MAKKKKDQPKPSKEHKQFVAHPGDDVWIVNGYDSKKKGPFIPKVYKIKRKQLDELRRQGWKYAPDFHREKSAERQKMNDAYYKMFEELSKK